ncbi:MAG: VanZ family protein [Bacteroidales bacterium]
MNRNPRALLFYWGPVVLYMAVIYLGSSIHRLPELPSGVSDKMAHFSEYAVLCLLLARALAGPRWLAITFPYVAGAIALAALYGMSDELHQWFVPGRDADVRDLAADALGACSSAGALWAWGIIRRNL